MLEYDRKRAATIREMLEGHRRALAEHNSRSVAGGTGRRLSAKEVGDLERKVRVFGSHLDRLESETEADKRDKLAEHLGESFRAMHRMDYLDFDKTTTSTGGGGGGAN